MRPTYRNKTLAMVSALILLGIGGVSAFTLGLYRHEKLVQIRRESRVTAGRLSEHLQSMLLLAQNASLTQLNASPELIFAIDQVCTGREGAEGGEVTYPFAVNALYSQHLNDIEVRPTDWLRSLEFFKACRELREAGTSSDKTAVKIVQSDIKLMVPHVTILVPTGSQYRLVALSMEGFEGGAGNVLFLAKQDGDVLWSVDGSEYVKAAFADTEIEPGQLKEWVKAAGQGGVGIVDIGSDGLLGYARVNSDWTLLSLSYKPTLLRPVNYALIQSLFLISAMIFICLFFGKRIAESIVRPLADLRKSADQIGMGKFDQRFEVDGENEVAGVKAAFNLMTDKIQQLIKETHKKTELESELKTVERVHKMLFPAKSVRTPQHGIHSVVQQATICGGDWWGYLELPRNGKPSLLMMVIGDVTGHGTESALVTAAARGALSVVAQYLEADAEGMPDSKRILAHFNRAVCEAAGGALAMTFFVAVMDPEKQEMYCSNAGHNRPYLIVNNDVKPIGIATAPPLGYARDSAYECLEHHSWTPGSKLVLYTDGLIDSEQFGRNKLRKTIAASSKMSSRALLNKIMQEHRTLTAGTPQADDITLVICEAVVDHSATRVEQA